MAYQRNFLSKCLYDARSYLEKSPKARPGICTLIVGFFWLLTAVALLVLNGVYPTWVSLILISASLLIIAVGSLALIRLYTKPKERRVTTVPEIRVDESDKQLIELRGLTEMRNVSENNCNSKCLAVPTQGKHLRCDQNHQNLFRIDMATRIFGRYKDPLVLRGITEIKYKCGSEFSGNDVTGLKRDDVIFVDDATGSDERRSLKELPTIKSSLYVP